MTLWTLILRSLRHHARAHLGVLLGAAIGSAVLIGALLVGDSVRVSLREMALARLGKVEAAMSTGDRLFRSALATNLYAASVLALPGTANSADGARRANKVHVLGVDENFWKLAQMPPAFTDIPPDAVVLNQPLADQLSAKPGDDVLLRVTKVSALSQDVSLTPREGQTVTLRLKVHAIAGNEQLGRFSLQANQVAPFNAFVRLDALQAKVGATNRANLLLLGTYKRVSDADPERFNRSLARVWQLADLELELRPLTNISTIELHTPRIFLDPPAVRAALAVDTNAQPVLTFLVNLLRAGEHSTPYSMVTAAGAPFTPADLRDDEIVINQWLADDLQVGPGAEISLTYFQPDSGARLAEATNRFRVRSIVPMQMPWADRTLMPDFPGIASAERAGDWDAGFSLTHKIRKEDDAYWQQWRGTPKAFVTLNAGRKMWANRFGDTTAIRFPLTPSLSAAGGEGARRAGEGAAGAVQTVGTKTTELEKHLLAQLNPADFGLVFQPVREQALKAAEQSQDFGGLFIGFSFFLIVAALVLVSLLFQFGVEQRATEIGTLLALGFTPKQVRRLLLGEGAGIAALGGVLGALGAVWYARAMLHGLSTVWRDAVGTSDLRFHAEPATLAGGFAGAVLVAVFSLWLALRKQVRQPARELLSGEDSGCGIQNSTTRKLGGAKMTGIVSLVFALALVGWALAKGETASAEIFFSAGALLLIAGLAFLSAFLSRLETSEAAAKLSLAGMGVRNATRRRRRSLATAAMLACGSFLIVSIGVFRLDENVNATKRSSGTGGFAFLGESTLPIVQDLNTKVGRDALGLDDKSLAGVSVVPFRVRDGDDASCLNLNRAQKPRILGVKPELLAERGAFAFASVAKALDKSAGWRLLMSAADHGGDPLTPSLSPSGGEGARRAGEGEPSKRVATQAADSDRIVPGIADEASILWALGKKLGDTIDFTDERGRPFKVRLVAALANSILQGSIVIDEAEFTARFPNESGYRYFLVDAPTNRAAEVSASLTKALRDFGLELAPATRRLAQLNAVQNTYLGTFQILGGLGLLLGSAGLGVVVLRNVLERRGELALLLAVGFRPRSLKWLVLSEHGALLLLGLGCGVLAATVAVLPALLSPNAALPYRSLALTLGAVLVSGAAWTWIATVFALRGRLLNALRNE